MDDKTARKIAKTAAHVANLESTAAVEDLNDWLGTPVKDWDADVIRQHAKNLEATGCHLRRLVASLEADNLIDA